MEIVKTNGAVVQEESSVLDAPCEPSSSSSIKDDDQNVDESEIGDGQSYCSDIKQVTSHNGIALVHKIYPLWWFVDITSFVNLSSK